MDSLHNLLRPAVAIDDTFHNILWWTMSID